MDRRSFLKTMPALVGSACVASAADSPKAADVKHFKITRVTGFRHVCPRPKFIGKNAIRDVHGKQTSEFVLRIATDQGIEGIGVGAVKPETARLILGHRLDEYWKPGVGVVSPLGRADHALFDVIGKALKTPAWKLLGGQGPEWVPVYDGSIYFADLLPEHEKRGVARIVEEVEASLIAGHRAIKAKVGRGHKWMPKEAGLRRDIEVVKAIRKQVGRNVRLMVDFNDSQDLESTKRWLDELGDDLFWIEEPFDEKVDLDLKLKGYLREKGWKTLLADGETIHDSKFFDRFIEREAIDVYQPDIRAFGLTLQWAMSRKLAAKPGLRLAPHNWGSFLGLHMQLVLAHGIPNFLMAEQDTATSDLFDTSAFVFKDGKVRVPDVPGCGLVLREDVFKAKYREAAWVVS